MGDCSKLKRDPMSSVKGPLIRLLRVWPFRDNVMGNKPVYAERKPGGISRIKDPEP